MLPEKQKAEGDAPEGRSTFRLQNRRAYQYRSLRFRQKGEMGVCEQSPGPNRPTSTFHPSFQPTPKPNTLPALGSQKRHPYTILPIQPLLARFSPITHLRVSYTSPAAPSSNTESNGDGDSPCRGFLEDSGYVRGIRGEEGLRGVGMFPMRGNSKLDLV